MAPGDDPIEQADEADVAEQSVPVGEGGSPVSGPPVISPLEADEADVLEQESIIEDDDESSRPREDEG